MNKEIEATSLFDGELCCNQHREGYRFSIDAVMLAHFISVKKNERILDIGTGSGIITLILLYRYAGIISECSGIEMQKSLFDLAKNNIINNNFAHKSTIYHCDVKMIKKCCVAGSYDKIICNPPFYPENTGRINRETEAGLARHQTNTNLADFLKGAAYAVKNRGSVNFIYPAERASELITTAALHKLEAKRMRFIYSYPDSTKGATLVLIESVKNGGKGLLVPDPLYIYTKKNGPYTREVETYYKRES